MACGTGATFGSLAVLAQRESLTDTGTGRAGVRVPLRTLPAFCDAGLHPEGPSYRVRTEMYVENMLPTTMAAYLVSQLGRDFSAADKEHKLYDWTRQLRLGQYASVMVSFEILMGRR